MNYYIYINKGLKNEKKLLTVYTDLDRAIAICNTLKVVNKKAKTVCTGFYKNDRFVKMYFTGPLELI